MLVSFTVANFRSFQGEQTLSMVASPKHRDHQDHLRRIPDHDESALPVAVIYGANGAGKSNLVKALGFVRDFILKGKDPKEVIGREPFRLGTNEPSQPSRFEMRFVRNEMVFSFGFTADDNAVRTEWLARVVKDREQLIYERLTHDGGSVAVELGTGFPKTEVPGRDKLEALVKVGVRPNQLFLTAVHQSLADSDQPPLLRSAIGWFESTLAIVHPVSSFTRLAEWVSAGAEFNDFIGSFLKEVGTGVEGLAVTELSPDMLDATISHPMVAKTLAELKPGEKKRMRRQDGTELQIERAADSRILFREIVARHLRQDGTTTTLPLREQSDGTIRLTHLAPALFQTQREQRVFIIDELDRSLHPLLCRKFVDFFIRACGGKGKGQIVLTTHESNLMDLDLLRRDELWFCEKRNGATELYSLSEFNVRTDLKVDKGYLQGRFGAIPFLGNVDRLIDQPC